VGLNLNDKKAVVAEVSAQVANAETIAIAEYRGIEVVDLTVLRKKARESGVYLRVLKNTLVRRAVEGTPFAALADQMVGPLIYSISSDPVAAAKVLNDFAKTNDKLAIKAGSYAGKVLDKAGVQALASVPKPRRVALQAAVRHAGSGGRIRPCSRRTCQAARRNFRLILTAYELF
jgi:large subunit ribosomal protein L10